MVGRYSNVSYVSCVPGKAIGTTTSLRPNPTRPTCERLFRHKIRLRSITVELKLSVALFKKLSEKLMNISGVEESKR